MHQSLVALRQSLRRKRRSLSVSRRRAHAHRLSQHLARHPLFCAARHIAVYLSNDGEPDLSVLIARAWRCGKRCYLPRLHPGQTLVFVRYARHGALHANRFGIPEPGANARRRAPLRLDLVLLPLVGFDRQGHRLGMGGGYYDRTFAGHRGRGKPYLLGVAHACQELNAIPAQPWDVPLWGVATELGVSKARRPRRT